MANLTSSLTLKLTDLLSGPAGEAAAALKKFGISAQDLQKSAKFDAFRQLQQSFAQARTTFREAQQNVRALAQQIAATDNPTKQMERSFAAAKREVISTSAAFQRQSAAMIASKAGLQSLGVPLNQLVTEETRLKTAAQAATVAMEQQAQRAQSIGARIRRGMGTAFGNIAPFLGPPILRMTYGAVKAGAEHESKMVSLKAAGIPKQDIDRALDMAMQQHSLYPNLKVTDVLERYKEAHSLMVKKEDAFTALPVIAQANAALNALEKAGKVEAGSATGLGLVLTGAETLGLTKNPERLRKYLDSYIKARQVMGDRISAEEVYGFDKGVKAAGPLLSDRFYHTIAMSLTNELGGKAAGVGIADLVKTIVAPSGAAAEEFFKLGLISRSDFEPPRQRGGFGKSFGHSTNKLGKVKFGHHPVGWELAQTDPDKWIAQYLLPAMKQHGITKPEEIQAQIEKMFQGRDAAVVSALVNRADLYREHAQRMRDAMGLGATGLMTEDPHVALDALTTSLRDFGGTLTSPVMKGAAHAMAIIARTAAQWTEVVEDLQKKYPIAAKVAAGHVIGGGLIGGGMLTLGLVRTLMGGFGLGKSALALDGSALALTRAAAALGASGRVPGGVPGGVVPVGGLPGKVPGGKPPGAWEFLKPIALYDTYQYGGEAMNWAFKNLPQPTYPKGYDPEEKLNESIPDRINDIWRDLFGPASTAARIPPAPPTAVPATGFRLDADRATKASPGDFSKPPAPTEGYRIPLPRPRPAEIGAAPTVILPDQTAEATAAGHLLAKAFVDSFGKELSKAEGLAEAVASRIIGYLTFSASPDVTPQAGGGGNTGGGGNNAHGLFSDYGIRP